MLLQNNLGKRKVSIQIIKNAKRNRYKRTNQHLYPKPLESFVKRTETKYEMKTKCVLINKEQRAKADKKEEDVGTLWFDRKFLHHKEDTNRDFLMEI